MTINTVWPKKYLDLDETDKLIARISQGLVGWLTFQKFIKKIKSINEHDVYHPIREIARSHDWRVQDQYKIKRCEEIMGRTIDFEFTKNIKQIVAGGGGENPESIRELSSTAVLEVKHIKHILRKESFHITTPKSNHKKNREKVRLKAINQARGYFSGEGYVLKDIENISLIKSEFKTKIIRGYIVISGNREAMLDFIPKNESENRVRNNVYSTARRILKENADCIFYSDGWRCDEVGEDCNKTTVLVLRNDGSWK